MVSIRPKNLSTLLTWGIEYAFEQKKNRSFENQVRRETTKQFKSLAASVRPSLPLKPFLGRFVVLPTPPLSFVQRDSTRGAQSLPISPLHGDESWALSVTLTDSHRVMVAQMCVCVCSERLYGCSVGSQNSVAKGPSQKVKMECRKVQTIKSSYDGFLLCRYDAAIVEQRDGAYGSTASKRVKMEGGVVFFVMRL